MTFFILFGWGDLKIFDPENTNAINKFKGAIWGSKPVKLMVPKKQEHLAKVDIQPDFHIAAFDWSLLFFWLIPSTESRIILDLSPGYGTAFLAAIFSNHKYLGIQPSAPMWKSLKIKLPNLLMSAYAMEKVRSFDSQLLKTGLRCFDNGNVGLDAQESDSEPKSKEEDSNEKQEEPDL